MAAENNGLLTWAKSVQNALETDPARNIFQDRVQTHGLDFLDNYLDQLLHGPTLPSIVELHKTPGKKRAQPTPSKFKSTATISLENDATPLESHVPVNSFHRALLQVKDATPPPAPSAQQPQSPTSATAALHYPSGTEHGSLIPDNRQEMNLELSVIAEGDESIERVQASITHSDIQMLPPPPQAAEPHDNSHLRTMGHDEPTQSTSFASSSADTFHTVRLSSPHGSSDILARDNAIDSVRVTAPNATQQAPPEPVQAPLPPAKITQPAALRYDNFTAPLPEIPPWNPRSIFDEANTAPLPSTSQVPIHDVDDPPPRPAPIATQPVRKSMRSVRDEKTIHGQIGSATPGAALLGDKKRTSWLIKAREVKALEETGKKMNLQAGPSLVESAMPVPGMSNTFKRKSVDMFSASSAALDANPAAEDERKQKIAKLNHPKAHEFTGPKEPEAPIHASNTESAPDILVPVVSTGDPASEGVLGRFKRTLEGFGVRSAKSIGNVAAANAIASARAAAETQGHQPETAMTHDTDAPVPRPDVIMSEASTVDKRLSVSELAPFKPSPIFHKAAEPTATDVGDASISTTPPNSPPHLEPVFNKLPPVFTVPVTAPKPVFNPPAPTFTKPTINSLGLAPRLHSPLSSRTAPQQPITAQSTLESVLSDNIFSSQDSVAAWQSQTQTETQDTDYSMHASQPKATSHMDDLDEDDSFDDRMATGEQWMFGGGKEDSMTWSTQPTQSLHAPPENTAEQSEAPQRTGGGTRAIPGAFAMDDEDDNDVGNQSDADIQLDTSTMAHGSQSQMSMSVSESQSQGIIGKAMKTMSSVLGSSKKGKPEVKSLQMAASAAKKQQEEKDKKATRLKEMENRRLLVNQKKAEEERAKTLEQERKAKEDAERRKREREELTEKRPVKVVHKKDEKRKIAVETEKKSELKKTTSKIAKPSLNVSKTGAPPKSTLKQAAALNSSFAHTSSQQSMVASTSKAPDTSKAAKPNNGKGKAVPKTPAPPPEDDISQPSQVLQGQMAARANAQLQAAKVIAEPTENIELPDINSEYSDSDDEDRPRTFNPPEWAQSPELRQALRLQSTINPDDIFGEIRPLRMEEIFRTRTSRFRARTSSANWTGSDRLTVEEEVEYARRMGFQ